MGLSQDQLNAFSSALSLAGQNAPASNSTASLYGFNGAEQALNVYMGKGARTKQYSVGTDAGGGGGSYYTRSDNVVTTTEAAAQFYSWNDQQRTQWGQKLYKAGLISSPSDYSGMLSAWQSAVQEAGNFYSTAHRKITPFQVVDLMADPTAAAKNGATGPKTTTSSSAQILSKTDAEAAIRQIFQDKLGRDPSKAEVSKYTATLKASAKANPTTTTTQHTYDSAGNETAQSSTQTGGYDPSTVIGDQVNNDPEYGAYQAAGQMMNWVQNAIAAP
jgi:hypothetical protein